MSTTHETTLDPTTAAGALDATHTLFSLSVLTSTKNNASKKLTADHTRRPVSDPAHKLGITTGTIEHVQLAGLADLRDLLHGVTTRQALVHGVHKGSLPGERCELVTLAVLGRLIQNGTPRPPGRVTRSLQDLDYPEGRRLLMFDVDVYPGIATPQSASELLHQLADIWPVFAEVGWLATVSTRSAIKDKQTHAWLTPPTGFHVYLLATGDVERFRDIARVHLWLAGTGYCKLASPHAHTGVSAVLERCLIDLSVFSPERLDYVAGAIIEKNAPFYQDRPAPELHPGAVLDLNALPDVTDEDRRQYQALVQAARLCVQPEREATVRAHIQHASPALDAAAVTLEVTARLERTDSGVLTPDHPLVFDQRRTPVTAGTVTAALDGKRLADPFEPDYRDGSDAIFHWNKGHWLINSFAHGVLKTYRLAQAEPPEPDDDDMENLLAQAEDAEDIDGVAALARQDDDDRGPRSRYRATKHGLMWAKPTKDGPPTHVLLSNFTAIIRAEMTEDDGVETRLRFALAAQLNGQTSCFEIPAAQYAGMSWVTEHLGATAIVMPGMTLKDHARAAIQLLSPQVERRHVYLHLGWRKIGETWCYLHAGGALGPDGPVPDVEVHARQTLAAYVLPGLTTREAEGAALRASLRLLDTADDAVALPLYAAIWRAVLGQADFSVHLVGPTGAGKSELAALAQQHYGAGMTARHLPASWTSTGNALEALAFEAKDVLLVVDDFCPSGAQADIARFHRDADRLLRAQGNHSGRQRMQRDGTLRAVKPPRGLIVSTGEDTPQGQSLRARLLILDVPKGCVQWDTLTPCQQDAADGTYATALAGFVQWLAPHYEDVSQGLQDEITALRQAALTSGHRRTPELVGNLALGMQYLLAYGHDIGALTREECTALAQRTWTAIVKAGEAQSEHQTNEEPVRRFLSLLTGALAAGLAHIADHYTLAAPSTQPQQWGWRGHEYRDTDGNSVTRWEPLGVCVGWLGNYRLYLEPEAVFSVAQKFGESQKAPLPITQQTLWKRMHEQGLLVREDGQKKNKVRKTIGSQRRYVVDISASMLPESGPSGPSGPNGQQPQQNQWEIVDRFPAWYMAKPVHSAEAKPVHSTAAQPLDMWTGFSPDSWTGFPREPVHTNDRQSQQNQGQGPIGPEGPEITGQQRSSTAHHADVFQAFCPRCGEQTTHRLLLDGRAPACVWCSVLAPEQVFHANGVQPTPVDADEEMMEWRA